MIAATNYNVVKMFGFSVGDIMQAAQLAQLVYEAYTKSRDLSEVIDPFHVEFYRLHQSLLSLEESLTSLGRSVSSHCRANLTKSPSLDCITEISVLVEDSIVCSRRLLAR